METNETNETAETVELQPAPADPPDMAAVREYFSALQVDLSRRLTAIEVLFGFIESTEALAVRLSKLEAFVGIK